MAVSTARAQLQSWLPRLVLAIMIASTVAVPLELKYFAPEIEAKLAQDNRNAGQGNDVDAGVPRLDFHSAPDVDS